MLTLADILEALTGERPDRATQVVTDAVIDSRKAIPGSLFIAIPGQRVDGHDFVEQAFENGASFALVQKDMSGSFQQQDVRQGWQSDQVEKSDTPLCIRVDDTVKALQSIGKFWRNKLDLRVIGITGSVGKSTTKEVVTEVLQQRYHTLKNVGNLNNEIGLPLTLLRLSEGYERAVLEMGFYVPGEITLLCDLAKPSIGVITNIGTVHAERAGSQEVIAQGKSELLQSLPADGVAILNHDDPWSRWMADRTDARVFFYGMTPEADLWADQVEGLGLEGIRFRLHYKEDVLHVRVPMIGHHSVQTALRAAAVGIVEGLTWQEIVSGLRSEHTQLRLVAIKTADGALILDDTYNASPESTLAALNLLSELDGHRIAVLGDMLELGRYERQGHEMVGVRAAQVVNELVTVGPRAQIIASSARLSGLGSSYITEVEDSQQAIAYLREKLTKNDIVLVKGSRSMHMEIIVESFEVGS